MSWRTSASLVILAALEACAFGFNPLPDAQVLEGEAGAGRDAGLVSWPDAISHSAERDSGFESDALDPADAGFAADAEHEDAASEDAAPEDAAPEDAAPEDAAPEDAAPEDAAPEDAAPEDSAPFDAGLAADAQAADAVCQRISQVLGIANTQDDGELETPNLRVHGEQGFGLMMGNWNDDPYPTWGYFRFQLKEALPAGSLITRARLDLWAKLAQSWDEQTYGLRIYLEDSADAPLVSDPSADPEVLGGRPLVLGSVRWPSSGGLSWPTDTWVSSPDLSQLFQSLCDGRSGLDATRSVQLWIRGDFGGFNGEVGTEDWSDGGTHRAVLTLEVCR